MVKQSKLAAMDSCMRRDDRYTLADASIEWTDAEGRLRRFQILDASRHGVCFGLDAGGDDPQVGTEIEGVVLRICGLEIRGRVLVTQASMSLSRGSACGGEFHPSSLDEEQRFRAVVAGLARRSRLAEQS